MSIHRGIAVAALMAILATAACDGGSDETQPTARASTKATPTPTVQASRDPAADRIPLAGDDDVAISWNLEKVNDSDPVVDVARRTMSFLVLAAWSTDWTDQRRLKQASDALAVDDSVLLKPLSKAAAPTEREHPLQIRILLQAPVVEGERATAWMCVDYDATAFRSKSGVLSSVTLAVTDGVWKVTDYNLNPEITAEVEPRFKRCRAAY